MFIADECAAKRLELTSAASEEGHAESNAGTVYQDRNGRFSIAIPQGWTATPQGANGAGGVQIKRGASWAFVGPFSNVKDSSGVVTSLAAQFRSQYRNFTTGQVGPENVNGRQIALGMYTGVTQQGVPVALSIVGMPAPGGKFFAMMSFVPQSDVHAATPALLSMLQSFRFTGE